MTINEIQAERLRLAGEYARAWKQVVVLKGALTVVSSPEGLTALIPIATPALSRAGTGDILSGMIAGLIAQGLDSFQAACAAAYLHGKAGLAAAEMQGNTGSVLASDILMTIPAQISHIK
jgi:NAD(P)H-hydrate repair Nnr-like enzyme with NAD(P)H-hydrate dehydratase domain